MKIFLFVADSSQYDGSHSGTLGKDRGHKGRKKWGGILGGKHKHTSRHYEDNVDGMRGLHDTLPKHPLPTTISKEAMVSKLLAIQDILARKNINNNFSTFFVVSVTRT